MTVAGRVSGNTDAGAIERLLHSFNGGAGEWGALMGRISEMESRCGGGSQSIDLSRLLSKSLCCIVFFVVCFQHVYGQSGGDRVSGDASIGIDLDGSELRIKTTGRVAGAIDSLTWKGKEFVDSFDHGRQIQSACSFDAMDAGPFWAERFNPTEAGSRLDGTGPTSTSRLLGLSTMGPEIRSSSRMAFWLAPGESSFGRPALNRERQSEHLLHKRIRLGAFEDKHIIEVAVTFEIPEHERHQLGQFEVLTGYMPPDFSKFAALNGLNSTWMPLDDGPGEQASPVVFCTPDERFALGVVLVGGGGKGYDGPGYGRFVFREEKVVKWNCVMRFRQTPAIEQRKHSFRVLMVVGDLQDVQKGMVAIQRAGDNIPRDKH